MIEYEKEAVLSLIDDNINHAKGIRELSLVVSTQSVVALMEQLKKEIIIVFNPYY